MSGPETLFTARNIIVGFGATLSGLGIILTIMVKYGAFARFNGKPAALTNGPFIPRSEAAEFVTEDELKEKGFLLEQTHEDRCIAVQAQTALATSKTLQEGFKEIGGIIRTEVKEMRSDMSIEMKDMRGVMDVKLKNVYDTMESKMQGVQRSIDERLRRGTSDDRERGGD